MIVLVSLIVLRKLLVSTHFLMVYTSLHRHLLDFALVSLYICRVISMYTADCTVLSKNNSTM